MFGFSNMLIKHKLWSGFALILFILVIVVTIGVQSISTTQQQVRHVVNTIQPSVMLAQDVENKLDKSVAALGFYLLSRQKEHHTHYLNHLNDLNALLKQLRNSTPIAKNQALSASVDKIIDSIELFQSYTERFEALVNNDRQRMPALAYSTETVNPIALQIRSLLATIAASENMDEMTHVDSNRKMEILQTANELRYSVITSIMGFRGFIAFKGDAVKKNTELYLSKSIELAQTLADYGDDLSFEQLDAVEQLNDLLVKYQQEVMQVIAIHSSEQAYQDVYLVKTQIAPLILDINRQLKLLVNRLKNNITDTSEQLLLQVEDNRNSLIILLLTGVIAGMVLAYRIVKAIIKPLTQLCLVVKKVEAENDFSQQLVSSGKDEIAQIINAFNKLLNSLQGATSEVNQVMSAMANGDFSGKIKRPLTGELEVMKNNVNATTQNINTAIAQINHVMSDLAAGSYTSRIETPLSGELSRLKDNINQTTEAMETAIKAVNEVMQAVAQGDLQQRVGGNLKGELHQLQHNINHSIDSLTQALTSIAQNTDLVADGSNQASYSVSQISNASNQQVEAISQIAQAVTRSNQAIAQVSNDTQTARNTAQQSKTLVLSGQENVKQMTEVVDLIVQNNENINKMTHAVSKIAEQTHLLSFNAAIEASHAKEHGKGFSVVAQQVRKLADNASQSAQHIIELAKQATQYGNNALNMATKVQSEMQKIQTASDQSQQLSAQIATAMQQQSDTSAAIDSRVNELRKISELSAESAVDIESSVNNLAQLAEATRGQIQQFKI